MAKRQSWAETDKSDTPFDRLRRAYAAFNQYSGPSLRGRKRLFSYRTSRP